MERYLVQTDDGSHSLFVSALGEQYHSRHGAIQESRHVFIEAGFKASAGSKATLRILEVGFGTGLNALLTSIEAEKGHIPVEYIAIEAYPLSVAEIASLNYPVEIGGAVPQDHWEHIHAAPWETATQILPYFHIQKLETQLEAFPAISNVDLIYFDAFAPEKQPELWTEEVFGRMFECLNPGGVLTTYCAKGAVRRAMQSVGFQVERLQGPPGKREMMRARKN